MKEKAQIDVEARARAGEENFMKGYNCAQSVVAAFADLIEDPEPILKVAASFGGGMGRLRMTCGAVSGMFMLAGLENGSPTPAGSDTRAVNYALVQELGLKFKEENDSVICAELLKLRTGKMEPPRPSERTADYYRLRPCPKLVACACRIYAQHLAPGRVE